MRYLLLLIFLTPLIVTAQADSNTHYRIYGVAQQKEISIDKLIHHLQEQQVIFFGEEHNDSIAHVLELLLLQGLHNKTQKETILSLEMFQSDVQLILNEYLEGLINETNFERDSRPWKNYKDYRPMVEYARQNNIPVIAANAPSRYSNRVTRKGLESLNDLPKAAKALLAPLPIDTLTGPYAEKFSGLMGAHEGMGSLKLYQSQNLWDATMAWHIARSLKKGAHKKRVLHVNGRFHSDEKLGTYKQLLNYAPKLRCANISTFSDGSIDAPNWEEWKTLGDFIIITRPKK